MEGIGNLIYTYLENGKQMGYGMLIRTILQSPPLLIFYACLVARWIVKKISQIIHIF